MTLKTDRSDHLFDDSTTEAETDEIQELAKDEIFHILQTSRRRETIRYLLGEESPVKMGDIAEYVAAREHDTTLKALTSAERQRVYIPLYQSHLPKLDEGNFIDYNQPRGIVHPTDRLTVFEPYLETADNELTELEDDEATSDRAAREYYVTALGASSSLLLVSAAGILTIPGVVLGAIITALFALVTLVTNFPPGSEATEKAIPR